MAERMQLRLHEDASLFREALTFTTAQTGFTAQLIEKDYFCSVILGHLAAVATDLIFKGGTCLAKVHADFYRLSEDLDFHISTPTNASRAERRQRVAAVKKVVATIRDHVPGLGVVTALEGANDSAQYNGAIAYTSSLGPSESVKIEISLREPLLTPAIEGEARTLLLSPISRVAIVPPVRVPCLSRNEAMAEKVRAALSRREVAIRDFYDVDYAVRNLRFDTKDPAVLELVKEKLKVPGNGPMDVSEARLTALRPQVQAQLRPVIRDRDFEGFNLDRAFATIAEVAAELSYDDHQHR